MTTTINFKIQGRHGEAVIVPNYNEGTVYMLNNLPGSMDDLKTEKIGTAEGYDIYANYYDMASSHYGYFAVKNSFTIYAIQFSNYNFRSQVLFVEAENEKEAIQKVKNFVAPQRFEYERTLSDNEVNRFSEEERCFANF